MSLTMIMLNSQMFPSGFTLRKPGGDPILSPVLVPYFIIHFKINVAPLLPKFHLTKLVVHEVAQYTCKEYESIKCVHLQLCMLLKI